MLEEFICTLSQDDKLIIVTTPGEVTDGKLTEKGRLQAKKVAEMLLTPIFRNTWHLDIQAVITTDTPTSIETAHLMAKYMQIDAQFISLPGFTNTPSDPKKEIGLVRAKTVQEALGLSDLVEKGVVFTRETIRSFSEGLDPGATTLVVGQNYWAELATLQPAETPFGMPPAGTMLYRYSSSDQAVDSLYLPPPPI